MIDVPRFSDVAPTTSGQPPSGADKAPFESTSLEAILTGRAKDAQRLFKLYDEDQDGLLSSQEVYQGLQTWGLALSPETFSQFVDCNFMYADRDLDGHLNLQEWTQLFKLMSEVRVLDFRLQTCNGAELHVAEPDPDGTRTIKGLAACCW